MFYIKPGGRVNHMVSNRAFGIEIECYVPERVAADFRLGRYHHGIQIRVCPTGWNAQSDGSLTDGCPAGFVPVEVVSPILAGEDGLTQAVYVSDLLRDLGAVVNGHCGLHIHVDARDLTPRQVIQVQQTFITFEKAFYGVSGRKAQSRWDSPYCFNSDRWCDSRYQSLNVHNRTHNGKGTLEFRVWAGTVLAEEIISAVVMAVAFINGVVDGVMSGQPRIECPVKAARAFADLYFRQPAYLPAEFLDGEDPSRQRQLGMGSCSISMLIVRLL
jgi:hypothetical protein